MATKAGADVFWSMRLNLRTAWSAFVHLLHCLAILALIQFVPDPVGTWLPYVWAVAAIYSAIGMVLLLRLGNYEGISDREVGGLIRRSYWIATGLYLSLLAISLFLIGHARRWF